MSNFFWSLVICTPYFSGKLFDSDDDDDALGSVQSISAFKCDIILHMSIFLLWSCFFFFVCSFLNDLLYDIWICLKQSSLACGLSLKNFLQHFKVRSLCIIRVSFCSLCSNIVVTMWNAVKNSYIVEKNNFALTSSECNRTCHTCFRKQKFLLEFLNSKKMYLCEKRLDFNLCATSALLTLLYTGPLCYVITL